MSTNVRPDKDRKGEWMAWMFGIADVVSRNAMANGLAQSHSPKASMDMDWIPHCNGYDRRDHTLEQKRLEAGFARRCWRR